MTEKETDRLYLPHKVQTMCSRQGSFSGVIVWEWIIHCVNKVDFDFFLHNKIVDCI